MRVVSFQVGYGPIFVGLCVLCKSGRWSEGNFPLAIESARYTVYEPLCAPMAFRAFELVTDATIGPRSCGVFAPQLIGSVSRNFKFACDARMMWRFACGT